MNKQAAIKTALFILCPVVISAILIAAPRVYAEAFFSVVFVVMILMMIYCIYELMK